ncbi:tail fiber assembly protein [Pseudomonas granadensis]|uniref:tail fiber assembly protein n=1 Tax=Pseudomonas granadensis TaxID=1421430 RepID=UPI0019D2F82E|nr:tail fiber assembly protein [Pseudomonas granadensis]MBN6775546.1 tail fiber assembly protein [Pseudomonas granadensis]MBN6806839.1 tail fiber assembly protein [Pseudomonas granadensis]MBN6833504.1 tail fiber assembly protein [Pseudomonas granadensis]MBN6841085.1 tail fiber assembly protein [Pseudomonas granadensis]MBN6866512.1 tail fiber assembly protein [Pseudomonas granadensis]
MNRYALTTTVMGYTVILQIVDVEGEAPAVLADEPNAFWRDITGNDTARPGMKISWGPNGNDYSETTTAEQQMITSGRMQQRFDAAARWLMFNPLQYKLDLGIATPADESALIAYKQYFIAVSEVAGQSPFPTINWPVAPF